MAHGGLCLDSFWMLPICESGCGSAGCRNRRYIKGGIRHATSGCNRRGGVRDHGGDNGSKVSRGSNMKRSAVGAGGFHPEHPEAIFSNRTVV